ncbi:ankyrin repeat and SAM domain-containing protein 4B-like [Malaya genurostris]|uniref:ankyrin repeat and SAM domain-containing protein 4B-like n=1 Tax=Malaya genurostris TaxID=325434 RepID=UPI0026F3C715|nr:ankyrin repeat and SAM domain-containing protein 4B-like [Malaya genurostris]
MLVARSAQVISSSVGRGSTSSVTNTMHIITKAKRYHKAAREANLKVLKEANRWEVNEPDENGMTPLLWAAHEGRLEAVRVLLERKGNVSKVDRFGNSALHLAAARGHLECVKLLFSKGANPYGLDGGHRTACDLARIGNWQEVVDFLERTFKMLEARNPKMVVKLKLLANETYAQVKVKLPNEMEPKTPKYTDEFGENEDANVDSMENSDELSNTIRSDNENVISDKIDPIANSSPDLIGLIQNKHDGNASNTSKSTARTYLVFSELIKEQSINQTIVNRLETRPQRKVIRSARSPSDDEDSDAGDDLPKETEATSLLTFLKIYDLQRFHQQLLDKGVDLDGLMLMTEQDVKALELPLGPHRKLWVALEEYKSARKWDEA